MISWSTMDTILSCFVMLKLNLKVLLKPFHEAEGDSFFSYTVNALPEQHVAVAVYVACI